MKGYLVEMHKPQRTQQAHITMLVFAKDAMSAAHRVHRFTGDHEVIEVKVTRTEIGLCIDAEFIKGSA